MSKAIKLKIKQNFTDKETKEDYKKGKEYAFSEKRAEELLKNPYLVEKVSEIEETSKEKAEQK